MNCVLVITFFVICNGSHKGAHNYTYSDYEVLWHVEF